MRFTDRDEISTLYRGSSTDASYQDTVHLAKRLQNIIIFFRNWPTRNKNCLWRPCLLTDRDEMSIFNRGSSIDASYQVSVHLVIRFQRRRFKYEKLTDDGRRTPIDGKRSCGISARWANNKWLLSWLSQSESRIYNKRLLIWLSQSELESILTIDLSREWLQSTKTKVKHI